MPNDKVPLIPHSILIGLTLLTTTALAQAPATPPPAAPAAPAATSQDAVASMLKVYVFPANNQTPDQQAKDSNDCYGWSKQQTGVDPTNLKAPPPADTSQAGQGSAVKGAAKGAAAGAAIGAIAGDAGKGAAIGATAGGMKGVGGKKSAQQQAAAQSQQQQQAAVNDQMTAFKKAYSACMEGKKYTVK